MKTDHIKTILVNKVPLLFRSHVSFLRETSVLFRVKVSFYRVLSSGHELEFLISLCSFYYEPFLFNQEFRKHINGDKCCAKLQGNFPKSEPIQPKIPEIPGENSNGKEISGKKCPKIPVYLARLSSFPNVPKLLFHSSLEICGN